MHFASLFWWKKVDLPNSYCCSSRSDERQSVEEHKPQRMDVATHATRDTILSPRRLGLSVSNCFQAVWPVDNSNALTREGDRDLNSCFRRNERKFDSETAKLLSNTLTELANIENIDALSMISPEMYQARTI